MATWRIKGSKSFITYGEHELSENIGALGASSNAWSAGGQLVELACFSCQNSSREPTAVWAPAMTCARSP